MGAELVGIDVSGRDVMRVSRLDFGANGEPVLSEPVALPFLTADPRANKNRGFVAQRRRLLPFSFSPPSQGVYFLTFRAPVSFFKDDMSGSAPQPWGASTTVLVDGQKGNRCVAPDSGA
jgi:hypothetical protein